MAAFKCTQAVATTVISSFAILSSAQAADFSFTGNLSSSNPVQFFNFTLNTESTVTLRTFSYGGGTQANGNVVAAGGFDPIVSLFNSATTPANILGFNDDGGMGNVSADPTTRNYYDSFLQISLSTGNYSVAISQFPNFSPFRGGYTDTSRGNNWALDILNVETANPTDPIAVAMHGL